MKKSQFISLLFSLVLLIACGKGLNGIYEGKNGIVSFHLEIKDKVASLKMNALIVGKYDASQILQAIFLQFFWLVVMVGLSQLIWKRVQSFITIQGS